MSYPFWHFILIQLIKRLRHSFSILILYPASQKLRVFEVQNTSISDSEHYTLQFVGQRTYHTAAQGATKTMKITSYQRLKSTKYSLYIIHYLFKAAFVLSERFRESNSKSDSLFIMLRYYLSYKLNTKTRKTLFKISKC